MDVEKRLNSLLEFLEPRLLCVVFVPNEGFHFRSFIHLFIFRVKLKITPLLLLQTFKHRNVDNDVKALLRKVSLLCGVILIEVCFLTYSGVYIVCTY